MYSLVFVFAFEFILVLVLTPSSHYVVGNSPGLSKHCTEEESKEFGPLA